MGYRSAARGFQLGMGIGQRAKEFDELQGLREAEERRRKERFKWDKKEQEDKAKFKVVKREVDAAKARLDAGDERGAAKKIADLYNEEYPNDDEVRIIFKSDAQQKSGMATDPRQDVASGAINWESDPNLKGKEMAVLSKSGGILPYKNMKDLMNYVATSLDYGQFKKDSDAVDAKIAEFNAKSPVKETRDGAFQTIAKRGSGGIVYEEKPVDSGRIGLTEAEKKIKAGERSGLKMIPQRKGAILGSDVKYDKDKEATSVHKRNSARSKAVTDKLKEYKTKIDLVKIPFVKDQGAMIVDPETAEITKAGHSAWDKANALLQKYEDKKDLTQEQRNKVGKAKRFLDVFNEMSAFVDSLSAKHINKKPKKKDWRDLRTNKPKAGLRLQSSREYKQ